VNLAKKGRPAAACVLVEGTLQAPKVLDVFELTSANSAVPTQLHDLGTALRSRVTGIKPDRVVIRRADFARRPSNKEGPRLRLLAEGALAACAHDEVSDVVILTGKDLAAHASMSKAALDAHAQATCPSAPSEAAAAALAGLV
jgi:hypothetical protein